MNTPAPRLPEPVALRLHRPRWRDPRLVLGLLLVAGSVALGSWAVTASARTVGVYAAATTLTPGARVEAGALEIVQMRGDRLESGYLLAAQDLPAGAVALRVVGAGELVPRAAIGDVDALTVRSVAVPGGADLSPDVVPGALVDLWHVPEPDADAAPRRFAESAVVHDVDDDGTLVLGAGARTVHVLVPQDGLAEVLGALAAAGEVRVVAVPGSGT